MAFRNRRRLGLFTSLVKQNHLGKDLAFNPLEVKENYIIFLIRFHNSSHHRAVKKN